MGAAGAEGVSKPVADIASGVSLNAPGTSIDISVPGTLASKPSSNGVPLNISLAAWSINPCILGHSTSISTPNALDCILLSRFLFLPIVPARSCIGLSGVANPPKIYPNSPPTSLPNFFALYGSSSFKTLAYPVRIRLPNAPDLALTPITASVPSLRNSSEIGSSLYAFNIKSAINKKGANGNKGRKSLSWPVGSFTLYHSAPGEFSRNTIAIPSRLAPSAVSTIPRLKSVKPFICLPKKISNSSISALSLDISAGLGCLPFITSSSFFWASSSLTLFALFLAVAASVEFFNNE